jgi:hypothetical protein
MRASRKKRNACRIAGPPHRIRGEKDGEVVQFNLSGAWRESGLSSQLVYLVYLARGTR